MRNRLFAITFIFAVAAAGHVAAAAVVLIPSELDLGTLGPSTVVPSSVWLLNTGDEPVELLAAKGSCGCTVLDFKPQTLASQAAVQVPVRVTAPKTPGRRKSVTVTFSMRDHDPVNLPVRLGTFGDAAASKSVHADPAEVDLGPVTAGNLVSASARLVNTSDAPQRVTIAKPSCPCITLPDFEPLTLAAGEAIDVQMEVDAPLTLGETSRDVTFVLEDRQVIQVPVRMTTTDPRVETLKRHLADLYPLTCTFKSFRVDGDVITVIACEDEDQRPRALVTCSFRKDGTVRSTLVEPIRS